MKPTLVIRPAAQSDIDACAEHIAMDSIETARRFLVATQEIFQNLLRMPDLGRAWKSSNPRLAEIRVHPIPGFRNFLVFYRPIEDGIEIIHVLHGARDVDAILEYGEPES